jgi:CheY-like chemotaxis protein
LKRVLLIDAETREVEGLASQLESQDTQVRVAAGGLYAMTMLERERPQLILSRADLGDMSGAELCAMVQRDPSLSGTRVVLLARNLEEKLQAEREGDFDLVLLEDRAVDVLANRLLHLLRRGDSPPVPEASPIGRPSAQVISGSLGILSFAELTQAFSQTGKTGRLSLDVEGEAGEVIFVDGRVRHAVFRERRGAVAFNRLFADSEKTTNVDFHFAPMNREEVQGEPQTIDQTAQQLLLSAAVSLDEHNTVGDRERSAMVEGDGPQLVVADLSLRQRGQEHG